MLLTIELDFSLILAVTIVLNEIGTLGVRGAIDASNLGKLAKKIE